MGGIMTDAAALRIDIVSDVVCPWCIIGYKQVERALTMIDVPVAAEYYWHPFELNPNMPDEGENTRDHIARKYGATPEQSQSNRQRLIDIGAELGFAFNYGPDMRIYNTFKAHKLLTMAAHDGGWQLQTRLKLALFDAYFRECLDVSDEAVLLDIVDQLGLDRKGAATCLNSDAMSQAARAEQSHWRDQNITGVPAIIFDQKFMVPGAQSADVFADVIRKVLAKRDAG
jgi:predicted DsbA family dithiol-disulfide isomerase